MIELGLESIGRRLELHFSCVIEGEEDRIDV
jgi:hypothetical protein